MKIYYARIAQLSDEEMQQAMQILPGERIERVTRTKLKQNQLQSVSAGLLLEYVLKEQGMRSRELTFIKNPDGKPSIAEYPKFHYNLSHSKDYVALVVDKHPVGIDIEGLRIGYRKLVKRYFSFEEQMALQNNWSDEIFTKLWTRKESYLKASGYGMRMPLDGFSTLEEQVQLNEKMCSDMIEQGAIYYLASISFLDGYWLSVCRKGEPVGGLEDLPLQQVDLISILKV